MERFYKILPECFLYKEIRDYNANRIVVNDTYSEFATEQGIDSRKYTVTSTSIAIVPSEKDLKNFGEQMKKERLDYGLRMFRKNSIITKLWERKCEKISLKVLRKPSPAFELGLCGRGTQSLITHDGNIYFRVSLDCDFEDPSGCERINGSEYFTVAEDCEAKEKAVKDAAE